MQKTVKNFFSLKIVCIFAMVKQITNNLIFYSTMDTIVRFANDNNINALTREQIEKKCPFAFATAPTNPLLSKEYTFANTATIINDMEKLGWHVVDAAQCRKMRNSRGIRSYHIVAFQNDDIKICKADGSVEAYPRLILQTSHDGTRSFRFMFGLYRLICSNGLIVSTAEFMSVKIRHIHYSFEEMKSIVNKAIESIPEQIEIINNMIKTNLNENQKLDFAKKIIAIRKRQENNVNFEVSDETLKDILTPVRKEDGGNCLWNVFNVLQEKVMKGMFYYAANNNSKAKKQRPIKSPARDIEINSLMFRVASSYMNTIEAA